MAAGVASLDLLPQREIDRINALGARLAGRLGELLEGSPLDLELTGLGSLMNVRGDAGELLALHRAALDAGLYIAPRGMLCVSTAMDDAVVDEAIARLEEAVSLTSQLVADPASGAPTPSRP